MIESKDIILARIRTHNMGFIVNGDHRKTIELQNQMLNRTWERYASGKRVQELDFLFEHDCYSAWLQMSENSNLNDLLPQKTRFRIVKRVIKRVMKVTTRYQEDFNRATISFVEIVSVAINRLRVAALKVIGRQNQMEFQMEEMQAHIEEMQLIIAQQQEVIDQLSKKMRND